MATIRLRERNHWRQTSPKPWFPSEWAQTSPHKHPGVSAASNARAGAAPPAPSHPGQWHTMSDSGGQSLGAFGHWQVRMGESGGDGRAWFGGRSGPFLSPVARIRHNVQQMMEDVQQVTHAPDRTRMNLGRSHYHVTLGRVAKC